MISIIIPLYNSGKTIKKTLESILSQDYKDFEIIIINDGSTDNGVGIVESLNDKRIRVYSQDNGGVSVARNKGIEEAKGEWLMFFDADDEMLAGALSAFVGGTLLNNAKIVVSAYEVVRGGESRIVGYYNTERLLNYPLEEIGKGRLYSRPGNTLYHHSIFNLFKGFDTSKTLSEDRELCLRLLSYYKVSYTPFVAMRYFECLGASVKQHPWDKNFASEIPYLAENGYYHKLYMYRVYRDQLTKYHSEEIVKEIKHHISTYGRCFITYEYICWLFKRIMNRLKFYKISKYHVG